MAGSRKVASAAVRGFGIFPATVLTMVRVAGPETRSTAIAARPAPEAMAKIVSCPVRVIAGLGTHVAGGGRARRGIAAGNFASSQASGGYFAASLTNEISAPRMTMV